MRHIFKRFGDNEVLSDINLTVADGEFVVLVGPSGCGKSTTLRLMAGLDEISQGEVLIHDKVVNHVQPQHRNIAMVFQNYALYPHKTVRANIVFGLKRAKASEALIEERLARAARILELENLLDRKPAQLSGGQRQRVAMGRAIVRDADVFLFDEPLSNLDAKLRHQMRTEIRRIHREYKTTTVYVTHDQVEAMTLGDKVVVMRDGRIEQMGTPMAVYLEPVNTFVATFIGAPAMNLLEARLYPDVVELEGQKNPLPPELNRGHPALSKEGQPVYLGIRPDFLHDNAFVGDGGGMASIRNGRIDIVEPLGFDRELNVSIGEQELKARLDLRTTAESGDAIDLCYDMRRAHFFDMETGRNLFIKQAKGSR